MPAIQMGWHFLLWSVKALRGLLIYSLNERSGAVILILLDISILKAISVLNKGLIEVKHKRMSVKWILFKTRKLLPTI